MRPFSWIVVATAMHLIQASRAEVPLPTSRPLGALLGSSTLAFNGWPVTHGTDGPCGKAVGYWQVQYVFKGDKGLKDKIVPIYGQTPLDSGARTTSLFFKGRTDCPEFFFQQEIGAERIARAIQKPDDCELQLQVISGILRGLATDCGGDDDCEAFSLHPNSCERPHPYARRAKSAAPAYWGALAANARQACGSQWARQPACAPVVMPVHCNENKCVEGPAIAGMLRFARATLGESCAPSDGPAVALSVSPQSAEYPQLNVSWWAEGRPQRGKAGAFELDGGSSYEKGFGATYCPIQNGCRQLRMIHLRLNIDADGKGELEFKAETLDGEKFDVKVPVAFGPGRRMFCG